MINQKLEFFPISHSLFTSTHSSFYLTERKPQKFKGLINSRSRILVLFTSRNSIYPSLSRQSSDCVNDISNVAIVTRRLMGNIISLHFNLSLNFEHKDICNSLISMTKQPSLTEVRRPSLSGKSQFYLSIFEWTKQCLCQ